MEVYAIHEDSHGLIGICATTPRAIVNFLVDTNWINEKYKIFIEKFQQWVSLRSYFGENWVERLCEMTMDELEATFEDAFYFEKFYVYDVPQEEV